MYWLVYESRLIQITDQEHSNLIQGVENWLGLQSVMDTPTSEPSASVSAATPRFPCQTRGRVTGVWSYRSHDPASYTDEPPAETCYWLRLPPAKTEKSLAAMPGRLARKSWYEPIDEPYKCI